MKEKEKCRWDDWGSAFDPICIYN